VRKAATTIALIEQHDAIGVRVEKAAHPITTAGAGAAVNHHDGFAVRIATDLPVDAVAVTYLEQAVIVRGDFRIEEGHDFGTPVSKIVPLALTLNPSPSWRGTLKAFYSPST
jgi:hypothetical protein